MTSKYDNMRYNGQFQSNNLNVKTSIITMIFRSKLYIVRPW